MLQGLKVGAISYMSMFKKVSNRHYCSSTRNHCQARPFATT